MKNVFINVTKQKYLAVWMITSVCVSLLVARQLLRRFSLLRKCVALRKYGAQSSAYTSGVYCFNILFCFPLFVYFRRFRSAWSSKRRQCVQCESNSHRVHRRRQRFAVSSLKCQVTVSQLPYANMLT